MLDFLQQWRWMAPSALTLGALVSGLTAVRFAAEGDFQASVFCVVVAAILDGLDGHVARFLGTCTQLGFELDSLCDLANFGVTPALVVYFWAKALPVEDNCKSEHCWGFHEVLWLACTVYAACCAFRLARFNVAGHAAQMDEQLLAAAPETPSGPRRPSFRAAVCHNVKQKGMYFRGVPAPVGALYALVPMILRFSNLPTRIGAVGEYGAWAIGRRGAALNLLVTAALMVSSLPTLSSKMLKTDRYDSHLRSRSLLRRVFKALVGSAIAFAAWRFPSELVLLMTFAHALSIPAGVVAYCALASDCDSHPKEE